MRSASSARTSAWLNSPSSDKLTAKFVLECTLPILGPPDDSLELSPGLRQFVPRLHLEPVVADIFGHRESAFGRLDRVTRCAGQTEMVALEDESLREPPVIADRLSPIAGLFDKHAFPVY